jgi:hypothetical protein
MLNPKTNTILNYFWEGKEEDIGEEYNSSGAHKQAALFSQVHCYPVPAPSTAAVGSHNALNSYDI